VKTIETTSLNWGALLQVSELVRYKNGNTLVANPPLPGGDRSQPMLLELDTANHVVWRMPFNPAIETVTTVHSFFE
jgi:hypothetical protein